MLGQDFLESEQRRGYDGHLPHRGLWGFHGCLQLNSFWDGSKAGAASSSCIFCRSHTKDSCSLGRASLHPPLIRSHPPDLVQISRRVSPEPQAGMHMFLGAGEALEMGSWKDMAGRNQNPGLRPACSSHGVAEQERSSCLTQLLLPPETAQDGGEKEQADPGVIPWSPAHHPTTRGRGSLGWTRWGGHEHNLGRGRTVRSMHRGSKGSRITHPRTQGCGRR